MLRTITQVIKSNDEESCVSTGMCIKLVITFYLSNYSRHMWKQKLLEILSKQKKMPNLAFLEWKQIYLHHLPGHIYADRDLKTGLSSLFHQIPLFPEHTYWILSFSVCKALTKMQLNFWFFECWLQQEEVFCLLEGKFGNIIYRIIGLLFFFSLCIVSSTRLYGNLPIKSYSEAAGSLLIPKMALGYVYQLCLLLKLSRHKIAWSGDHVAALEKYIGWLINTEEVGMD